jgi:hypothetical protein
MVRGIPAMFGAGPARFGSAVKPNGPDCLNLGWICDHPIFRGRTPVRAANAGPECRANATARKDKKSRIIPASFRPDRQSSNTSRSRLERDEQRMRTRNALAGVQYLRGRAVPRMPDGFLDKDSPAATNRNQTMTAGGGLLSLGGTASARPFLSSYSQGRERRFELSRLIANTDD